MGVRVYPDKPRVYFDMDGVVADFETAMNEAGSTPSEFKLRAGVYRNLPLIDGALEAIAELIDADVEVWFLTKPPGKNPYSTTEKLQWVKEHFPELYERVIITPDKGAVGTSRDILVDDHPEWANANNFPGTIIKFEGDWDSTLWTINATLFSHDEDADPESLTGIARSVLNFILGEK